MKKLLLLILAFVLLFSGGCEIIKSDIKQNYDILKQTVEENRNSISSLEKVCKEANQEVLKLKELLEVIEIADYITSVTPIIRDGVTVGYTLSFFRSGDMMVFNGTDGHSPEMGIKKHADGVYYWTLDGRWYLNDKGNRVKVAGQDGITPQMRINEDSIWEISFDNGHSWTAAGVAIGSDGYSFFKDVQFSEDDVLFTLMDGTQFSIPAFHGLDLKIDAEEGVAGAIPGNTVNIGFSVEGLADKSRLIISSDGNYAARADWSNSYEGTFVVTCPKPYVEGYINVLATDGNGYSSARTIKFIENQIEFPEGKDYRFTCDGGNSSIQFKANFNWFFKVTGNDAGWLSVSESDTDENTLNLTAGRNLDIKDREAVIQIFADANPEYPIASLNISQDAAYFNLEKLCYAVPAKGESVKINIKTSYKIVPTVASSSDWIQADVIETGKHEYRLTLRVNENGTDKRRKTSVKISGDGRDLTTLTVIQLSRNEDDKDDMVFEVVVNYVNNFTSCLPLCNNIDCIIDWGDQTVDYYYHRNLDPKKPEFLITHKYKVASPTTFKVRISGKVEGIQSTSENMDCASIKKVVQWGNVGLKSMFGAFSDNSILESVAGDTRGAFANVQDFTFAFSNCIRLREIDPLMFDRAVNMTTAYRTFECCRQLETIPERLFANCSSLNNASHLFLDCPEIEAIPEQLFANCSSLVNASFVFSGCNNVTTVSSTLFEGCYSLENVTNLLSGCNLKALPSGLLSDCRKIHTARGMVCGCKELTIIPDDLFSNCTDLSDICSLFENCGSLQYIPPSIFDKNLKIEDFTEAFCYCSQLSGECPYSMINGEKVYLYQRGQYPNHFKTPVSYKSCFFSCTNMTGYDKIPDSWKSPFWLTD